MLTFRFLATFVVLTGTVVPQAPFKIVKAFSSPNGTKYLNGLAYSRGQLFTCNGLTSGRIYRLDAHTGTVLGSFMAPTTSIRGMTHDGFALWVAGWLDKRLYRLHDTTGTVIGSFPVFASGGNPDGLAWDGSNLLVSDEQNRIHWFTAWGTQLRSISVPAWGSFNPRDLGWDGTNVWAGYQSQSTGRIRKHDPKTGAVLIDIPWPSGPSQQGLEWADWHLWAGAGRNSTIYQIDVGAPYVELVGNPHFPNPIRFKLTEGQKQVGDLAVVLLSASGTAGFSAAGVTVPLTLDAVTFAGISLLSSFTATVDATGVAQTPWFAIPPIQPGKTLWAAAVTVKGTTVTGVTDPFRFRTR